MPSHTLSEDLSAVVASQVRLALAEDVGDGDVTAALIDPNLIFKGQVLCRESAVLCGQAWFEQVFAQLSQSISIDWQFADGDRIAENAVVCTFSGNAQVLLTGERSALNFLQTLSSVATNTAAYVDAVAGLNVRILDTRKTLPGLRMAQKYAVRCGGGSNHRIGLYDAYLIKENHISAFASLADVLQKAQAASPGLPVEIEVENLTQLRQALKLGAKGILLDNFSLPDLTQAVQLNAGQARLEASGGIDLNNVRQVAMTGVDDISIGALTKHVRAVDFSFLTAFA